MKIFIVEDEKAALRILKSTIREVCQQAEFVGESDTVSDTIEWFQNNKTPDLVFMDIHLADGSAFEVFEHTQINCPIIFTTAYDEYALKAFKVNSIDYLLKPISKSDLKKALSKLELLRTDVSNDSASSSSDKLLHDDMALLDKVIKNIRKEESYKTHILIPAKGDKLVPLEVYSIMYVYISDGIVKAVDADNKHHILPQTLDDISEMLNPKYFFRANRQYLISKKSIRDVSLWFNGRLVVNMKTELPLEEKIIISKAKVAEFKDWF